MFLTQRENLTRFLDKVTIVYKASQTRYTAALETADVARIQLAVAQKASAVNKADARGQLSSSKRLAKIFGTVHCTRARYPSPAPHR